MVVTTLADQCSSQEDLGKLTTTTTGLLSGVDTLLVALESVHELLQQLAGCSAVVQQCSANLVHRYLILCCVLYHPHLLACVVITRRVWCLGWLDTVRSLSALHACAIVGAAVLNVVFSGFDE